MLLPWLSSGKPISAIAIAQLVERGLLDIDKPVVSNLPEFGVNGKNQITTRHLLTHTGGSRSADTIPEDMTWPETIARICEALLEALMGTGLKSWLSHLIELVCARQNLAPARRQIAGSVRLRGNISPHRNAHS